MSLLIAAFAISSTMNDINAEELEIEVQNVNEDDKNVTGDINTTMDTEKAEESTDVMESVAGVTDDSGKNDERTSAEVLNFMQKTTKIKDPFSLRDPFKKPYFKQAEVVDYKEGGFKDGIFTNLPTIENLPLSEIFITGVLIGKERRAIATLSNGETVLLKEGMKLGTEKSEIKAIMPGGIILVEKITNVYGQIEYLETVIPIVENRVGNFKSGSKRKIK